MAESFTSVEEMVRVMFLAALSAAAVRRRAGTDLGIVSMYKMRCLGLDPGY